MWNWQRGKKDLCSNTGQQAYLFTAYSKLNPFCVAYRMTSIRLPPSTGATFLSTFGLIIPMGLIGTKKLRFNKHSFIMALRQKYSIMTQPKDCCYSPILPSQI